MRASKITAMAALFMAAGLLSACYLPTMDMKKQTTMRMAVPNSMFERTIEADPYNITTYERIGVKGGTANVYIEGGELVWDDFIAERETATPSNPLALHLSTRDNAKNIIWLARPCQFTYAPKINGSECTRAEWANGRYSVTNLRAMNTALDNVKKKYGFTGFNLIGVQDGAGVAVHLAAARDDILSLRTVSGMLDTDVFVATHGQQKHETIIDQTSNNPGIHAQALAHLPQQHFIGQWAGEVGPAMAQAFRTHAGNSPCIRVSEVKSVTDEKGWVNRWPDLLQSPLDCKAGTAQ
ncbi:MAG TPA: hypothetical protein VGD95_06395 [Micavibrio sp.]